jgi:NAD(P)-dependent dehydrogenase (short-subunit alcohol dehydrogenase family)
MLAVVTGGTGSLGRAVTAKLAEDGFDIRVSAISDADAGRYGGPGAADVVDLRDLAGTRAWIGGLGPIGGAVLCAGGFAMRTLAKLEPGDLDAMLDINLRTAANTLAALAPVLEDGAGVVIIGAQTWRGGPSIGAYAASKAGAISLAKTASVEWKSRRIRVNAVLPDIMDTPANRASMPDADFGKWAKVEEVAAVCAWLLSPASGIASGNTISVGR